MPFLFIIVGIVMLASSVRGTTPQLIGLVKGDFTGQNNFIYWLAAMGVLGGLGYVGPLRTPSRYFMALVLIVLFLKNGGVFQKAVQALNGESSQVQQGNQQSSNSNAFGNIGSIFGNSSSASQLAPYSAITNAEAPTGLETEDTETNVML